MHLHCLCVTFLGFFPPLRNAYPFSRVPFMPTFRFSILNPPIFLTDKAQKRHHQINQDSCPPVQQVLIPLAHQPDPQGSITSLPVP